MSKQGMERPKKTHNQQHNETAPVPEIQGKAKHTKAKANPIITEAEAPPLKVFHTTLFSEEKPISSVYPAIDNDLARDNLENDIPAADLQDL